MKLRTEIILVFLLIAFVLFGSNLAVAIATLSKTVTSDTNCLWQDSIICWQYANKTVSHTVFNFSVFLPSIAIFTVLYSIVDERFKFRVHTAPINLPKTSFWTLLFVGGGSLLSDLLFEYRLPIPIFFNAQILWQAFFGLSFFTIVALWVYFTFMKPACFSKKNYQVFAGAIVHYIIEGDDKKMRAVTAELNRSIENIVSYAANKITKSTQNTVTHAATDILLAFGNRRFCAIAVKEPRFAMQLFRQISTQAKYNLPISQFAKNFASEAIMNKASLLHHEHSGYDSGFTGYYKFLTNDMYGDYALLEHGNQSAIDIPYTDYEKWDDDHLATYLNCVLTAFKSYLSPDGHKGTKRALRRAFSIIENNFTDLSLLDGIDTFTTENIHYKKLMKFDRFISDLIDAIEKSNRQPAYRLRQNEAERYKHNDIYDLIAELIFNIGDRISYITSPSDTCWAFHHNLYWGRLFSYGTSSKPLSILQFKLRRLFFNEIVTMDNWANYKNSRILGLCLNVMGLKAERMKSDRADYPLRRAVVNYTQKHLYGFVKAYPELKEVILTGDLSLNKNETQLVKTYSKWIGENEPKKDILVLSQMLIEKD